MHFTGITLLETLLALGIGGAVLASSLSGVQNYTEGLRTQAAASFLSQLTEAADQYAAANYQDLRANAPQTLPISVIEPFYGNTIGTDAFGSAYELATRTYPITVPDPAGGTRTENALQVLVVARGGDPALTAQPQLRAQVANTVGAQGAFITSGGQTCLTPAGAPRPDGHVCGAYGSFSFDPGNFPTAPLGDAVYAGLVTKGDSAVYDDALQRYDFGDPDLNTMSADLIMARDRAIRGEEDITLGRPAAEGGSTRDVEINAQRDVRVDAANTLSLRATQPIVLDSQAREIAVAGGGNRLTTDDDTFQITEAGEVYIGNTRIANIGGENDRVADGLLYADGLSSRVVSTDEINSRGWSANNDLRINNKMNSHTIFGRRAGYNPSGDRTGYAQTYEVGTGNIYASNVSVRDVTCADCGGSLAEVLPKWRQMGTYYIDLDNQVARIPKPNCGAARRFRNTRGYSAFGEPPYYDGSRDDRYTAKIIVVPKNLSFTDAAYDGLKGFNMRAVDRGSYWDVQTGEARARVTGLAMSYCVFNGGAANPESGATPHYWNPHNNVWGNYYRRD